MNSKLEEEERARAAVRRRFRRVSTRQSRWVSAGSIAYRPRQLERDALAAGGRVSGVVCAHAAARPW